MPFFGFLRKKGALPPPVKPTEKQQPPAASPPPPAAADSLFHDDLFADIPDSDFSPPTGSLSGPPPSLNGPDVPLPPSPFGEEEGIPRDFPELPPLEPPPSAPPTDEMPPLPDAPPSPAPEMAVASPPVPEPPVKPAPKAAGLLADLPDFTDEEIAHEETPPAKLPKASAAPQPSRPAAVTPPSKLAPVADAENLVGPGESLYVSAENYRVALKAVARIKDGVRKGNSQLRTMTDATIAHQTDFLKFAEALNAVQEQLIGMDNVLLRER